MGEPTSDQPIVVAVDRTPVSTAALEWAAEEALLHARPLMLVHAVTPVIIDTHDPNLRARIQRWRMYCAREFLAETKAQLVEHTALGDEAISTVSHLAHPVELLTRLSDLSWMIVLGSRFHGSWGGRRFGSVSAALCYRANCPVAVIHSHHPDHAGRPVLLGSDGSEASAHATAIAFAEAARRGVGLTAVHAWSDDHVLQLLGADWDRYRADAEAVLHQSLTEMRLRSPGPLAGPGGRARGPGCRRQPWSRCLLDTGEWVGGDRGCRTR